ncbi:MAG: hypothetical protein ACI4VW_03545 [Acutalibacteraceae bacterium]
MEKNIYKEMYYRLFNRTTDIMYITDDERAINAIIQAHLETEEMFMNFSEEQPKIIDFSSHLTEKKK